MLQHTRSAIENLPLEIIQDVFLFTNMDPNMPRASHILAQGLTDRYVLSKYCEKAFQLDTSVPSWERSCPRQAEIRRQEEVFRMRWMTWDFFSWYLSWRHQQYTTTATAKPVSMISAPKENRNGYWEDDLKIHLPWLPLLVCSIPDKLLKSPFTPSKLAFLRCLLSISRSSIDWANPSSVRLSVLAKRQAILDRNLDAVHLISHSRRLSKAPTMELVRFAVLEGGCDRSIVLELMSAARAWGHRRWEDVELDAWVARETARGNPKGKWLGVKLVELRSGLYPNSATGDYDGDRLVVKHWDDGALGFCSRFGAR